MIKIECEICKATNTKDEWNKSTEEDFGGKGVELFEGVCWEHCEFTCPECGTSFLGGEL